MKTLSIAGRAVGAGQPCFIVAEMSANHGQDFDQAVRIIKAAAAAGADAIKVQTFTPALHTIDSDKPWFRVGGADNPERWQGQTFYELYQTAYLSWEWHAPLKAIAEAEGLLFFSTPVEATGVAFLEQLGVPCHKVASYEATDLELLATIAATGKPVLLSVGFATLDEIELSVATLRENGATDIVLLHCTTSYQAEADASHTNLRTMLDLAARFDVAAGFSDNMGGIDAPVLAAAMGAAVIEKHLVVEHGAAVLDDRFSLDEQRFREMVDRIRANERLMGTVRYGCQNDTESYNRNFRRSLFVVEDVQQGEVFSRQNVRSIRPGYGLPPKHLHEVLGATAKESIERGTPLAWDLINTSRA